MVAFRMHTKNYRRAKPGSCSLGTKRNKPVQNRGRTFWKCAIRNAKFLLYFATRCPNEHDPAWPGWPLPLTLDFCDPRDSSPWARPPGRRCATWGSHWGTSSHRAPAALTGTASLRRGEEDRNKMTLLSNKCPTEIWHPALNQHKMSSSVYIVCILKVLYRPQMSNIHAFLFYPNPSDIRW